LSRIDDLKAVSDEENDTYALDIIHARSTGIRDDIWTEGEFVVLQRYFSKNLGGVALSYDAIRQLVDAAKAEAEQIMNQYAGGMN